MTRNLFLRNLSVILLASAAILPLSACASYGDDYADGGYYGGAADQNLYYQNANIDDVRYSITNDMYNQGFYLAYDGNPLVFERQLSDDNDIERISFWFTSDPGGVQVSVDQEYYSYGGNGWNESQVWNGPGQPFYIYGQLGIFHQEFYRHPRSYWDQRRNRDRDRDWSRRDERQQKQGHGSPSAGHQGYNRLPPLPAPSHTPRPRSMQSGASHDRQDRNFRGNTPRPQNHGQPTAKPQGQPQPQYQGGQQHQGEMNFHRQNPQNGQERHFEPQGQPPQAPARAEQQHEQMQRAPSAAPQQQQQMRQQEMQKHWRERQQPTRQQPQQPPRQEPRPAPEQHPQ